MKTLGESDNFILKIDDAMYTNTEQQNLGDLKEVFLENFESDYSTICGWYGVAKEKVLGSNNRATVTLLKTTGGETYGYSQSHPTITLGTSSGTDFILQTFAHEMNHIMESYKGNWIMTTSQGEGLSRVVGDILHPQHISDYVNAWLAYDPIMDTTSAKADSEFRKDWISVNFNGGELKNGGYVKGFDDSYSYGCAILFIFFLRDQLGFSMTEICQSVGDTLGEKYQNLTNSTINGFSQFKSLLDVHFPGVNSRCIPNNPFPLAFTNVPLASTGYKGNLFVFARMLNGRVLFNQAKPGNAFDGWSEIPGGMRSDVALAAGMQNDTLVVFAKSLNGKVIFNQKAPGMAFIGWQEVPGDVITNVPLASAGRKDNLFVFAKTIDGRIIFNQAAPDSSFVGWQEVLGNERTDVGLAAGMQNDTLVVFAKRLDGKIIFNQAAPGNAFIDWQEVPGGVVTNTQLAAAGRKDNLFVFAKTIDGRIIFNQAAPDSSFVGWQEVPGNERTDVAVAAGMQNETLVVFAKTLDGRIIFNQAAPNNAFDRWQELKWPVGKLIL